MDESILITIKNLRGIMMDDTSFDKELITYINTALAILEQAGVGVDNFFITSEEEIWGDFLPDGKMLEASKSFVGQKVQTLFDPPQNSSLMNALQSSLNELLWRVNLESEM